MLEMMWWTAAEKATPENKTDTAELEHEDTKYII